MSEQKASLQHHRSAFDDGRSISITLYMTLVGYGVLVGIAAAGGAEAWADNWPKHCRLYPCRRVWL